MSHNESKKIDRDNYFVVNAEINFQYAQMNLEVGQSADSEDTDAKIRKHKANQKIGGSFNTVISTISQCTQSVLLGIGAAHAGAKNADSIFNKFGEMHKPLHEISATHYEGTRQIEGVAAESESNHSDDLGKVITRAEEARQRGIQKGDEALQSFFEMVKTVARNSANG